MDRIRTPSCARRNGSARPATASSTRTAKAWEEAARELRQIRGQVLEIMGLLAAVIAFITTAANIAAGQPARPAAGLLTLAGGVTLLVFWGFHVLLVGTGSTGRRSLPAVVGVILVAAGFLMTELH